jgi:hypothetical protein
MTVPLLPGSVPGIFFTSPLAYIFACFSRRPLVRREQPAGVVNPDHREPSAFGIGERLQECLFDRHAFWKSVGMRTLAENLDRYVGKNGRVRIAVKAHVDRKDRPIWKGAAVFDDPDHVPSLCLPTRRFRR